MIKCQKCESTIKDSNITAEVQGEQVYVLVCCPDCLAEYWRFITFSDMTNNLNDIQ